MGCDIHSFYEVKKKDKWIKGGDIFPLNDFDKKWEKKDFGDSPFSWRSYSLFSVLAGIRNYGAIEPISKPRGIPEDVSKRIKKKIDYWESDGHSHSYFTIKELLEFDWNKELEDRRYTKQIAPNCWDGAATCKKGKGKIMTYREYLGEAFFDELKILEKQGKAENVRIVFWFDNLIKMSIRSVNDFPNYNQIFRGGKMAKKKTFDYIDKSLTAIDKSLKGLTEIAKTHNEMIVNLGKRIKILEEQK